MTAVGSGWDRTTASPGEAVAPAGVSVGEAGAVTGAWQMPELQVNGVAAVPQAVPSGRFATGAQNSWARLEEQVVAYVLQGSAVPGGLHTKPAVQAARQVPTSQMRPEPQGVASGWLPPTTQVLEVNCAEQEDVYVLQGSAVPAGVHAAFGTHAAMQLLARHTFPEPHVVPSAREVAAQVAFPEASHAVAYEAQTFGVVPGTQAWPGTHVPPESPELQERETTQTASRLANRFMRPPIVLVTRTRRIISHHRRAP